MTDEEHELAIGLLANGPYEAGMPMFISVEVRNVSSSTSFSWFPPFDMLSIDHPVALTLKAPNGRTWSWPVSQSHEEPKGISFGPGDARRALYDLSEIHADLPPGHYQLFAEYGDAHARVSIEIRPSRSKDAAIAKSLRVEDVIPTPTWQGFLYRRNKLPDLSGLSAEGRNRLAYYLYLHRVAHAQTPIGELDPHEPDKLGHGLLESEAALLRLEILQAAGRSEAKGVAAAIHERWPGLDWRLEEIERGQGLLASLRRTTETMSQ